MTTECNPMGTRLDVRKIQAYSFHITLRDILRNNDSIQSLFKVRNIYNTWKIQIYGVLDLHSSLKDQRNNSISQISPITYFIEVNRDLQELSNNLPDISSQNVYFQFFCHPAHQIELPPTNTGKLLFDSFCHFLVGLSFEK